MNDKIEVVIFSVAIVGICMCVQVGMIGCDAYEWCREKVKGPRHTIDDM